MSRRGHGRPIDAIFISQEMIYEMYKLDFVQSSQRTKCVRVAYYELKWMINVNALEQNLTKN